MSALQHYALFCDAAGCDATFNVGERRAGITRQRAAQIGWTHRSLGANAMDLCPEHGDASQAPPVAGEPLPAVCVDEVWLPVEVMREIRDCLAERARWFAARGHTVPAATRDAARQVDFAIDLAAGHPDPLTVSPRDTALARAAVRYADEHPASTSATDEELHEAAVAFARSLSPTDRKRLGQRP